VASLGLRLQRPLAPVARHAGHRQGRGASEPARFRRLVSAPNLACKLLAAREGRARDQVLGRLGSGGRSWLENGAATAPAAARIPERRPRRRVEKRSSASEPGGPATSAARGNSDCRPSPSSGYSEPGTRKSHRSYSFGRCSRPLDRLRRRVGFDHRPADLDVRTSREAGIGDSRTRLERLTDSDWSWAPTTSPF